MTNNAQVPTMPIPSTTGASVPTSTAGEAAILASPSGGPAASPKAVKRMEKEIRQEAKYEEKELKSVTKDMDRTKKAEMKVHKVSFP